MVLSIKGVNQFYGESHTLWDIDLEVEQGSCVCLMGRNGVGKTTLLKTIMGSLPLQSGSIMFNGKELSNQPVEQRARIGIGYVPQGREIFPQLTVEENLKIGLSARADKSINAKDKVYEMFPVLKEMLSRRGGDLSGGQQQQLAIGRALMLNPTILLLDEPTEGIQPNIVAEIGDVIMRLNEEDNITVLIVEQKLPFSRRVGKQFEILDRGRNVARGEIGELSDELVQKYLTV
ncbi:Urea ABC transporter, ATPase protein UrtE [hydrothermal vent metagenome]|uniref:Urea ABC transporter, ATPase protein UrtE n=1 Tax=hydrothermal vent metagenome TaxID=652676 RepID=A0A3B1A9C0_9ZZZZ